jgi:excisionase family DNA binding protein
MSTATEQRYLDYPAAARYSGMSEATLRRLVDSGRLKAYRPTGQRKVVFDRAELDEFIHSTNQLSEHGQATV